MERLMDLPPGRAATEITLRTMADLTRSAAMTQAMREKMIDLLQSLHAPTYRDYVQDVDTFVRSNVMLINEPGEVLVDPLVMLRYVDEGRAAGDCDDASMLAAALLYAAGIKVRFKAVFPHPEGGFYQHVFVEYMLRESEPWRPMDLTIDHIPVYPDDWIVKEVE